MKLAEAIARDMPFQLELGGQTYPLAWVWELRDGGIAFCFPGWGQSPSAESHMHRGAVEGDGPWSLLDLDRQDDDGTPLRVRILPARQHPPEGGSKEKALRYFRFWHDRLPADAVLESPHNRR